MNSNHTKHGVELKTQPEVYALEGWTLHKYDVVTSTNLVAASLPAWSAVRADTQTNGRGRFQRKWVSDEGGLWLSAVVPVDSVSGAAKTLPLAVGLAVCEALANLGVAQIRMRWPNDVLVNERKLAGLLLDQFSPGLAVAGIGINVSNHPETREPSLRTQTTRLADLVPKPPELSELTSLVLQHLRGLVLELKRAGFESILPRLNGYWAAPRQVELDLDGRTVRGSFTGVDQEGRLILENNARSLIRYESQQVRHLQELSF